MVQFVLTKAMLMAMVCVKSTQSVLYGDEHYSDIEGGKFWAFYNSGISIIDPETCEIEKNITKDDQGQGLPSGWSDGIYMQYQDPEEEAIEGYILINSRINRLIDQATGEQVSDVYVVDTVNKEVVSVIEVGPRVVHSYGVYPQNQFYTHSDGDGHFYVIDLADLSKHQGKVQAHQELPFHGKLLWDEDGTLGNRGFATSTGEQYLFEVDLEDGKYVQSFDYSSYVPEGVCSGLHAIAYSATNQHVYVECSPYGGTLEFDVSGGKINFVHQHPDATGALYETPDGSFVVASNKVGNKLHIFKPDGTGEKSSVEYTVDVPGHPSTVSFFPLDDDSLVDHNRFLGTRKLHTHKDYRICSPLTETVNMNHRDENEVFCDYYGCPPAETSDDVDKGRCLYDDDNTMKLKRVTEVVTADSSLMELCANCADESAFDNGECICTPNCGSCDANINADTSAAGGYACFTLSDVITGESTDANIIRDAGGVKQGSGYSGTPECSFGRTYRSHKRGTKYDASVSNYPHNSIVILNMETQQVQCEVRLPGAPARIIYAPETPEEVPEITNNSAGSTYGTKADLLSAIIRVVSTMALVATMTFV